ncbi:MAG: 3-hydroxyacyl-CoA dehydrogenase [Woeseiaceae bacterium]|nr:3-hydroxyacyl-CoA dehydrogenase [Woeseiaceae bacterium]
MTDQQGPVAIVGAGSIGAGFAIVHATAGRSVLLYDAQPEAAEAAIGRIAETLADLEHFELLDEPPAAVLARVSAAASLEDAVAKAAFVHECVSENLDLKRQVTADIDARAPGDAVIGSASSAIPASDYAAEVPGNSRCLVAHPGNPPFLLRVVEVVPAPFTDPKAVDAATRFLGGSGLATVTVRKEPRGFVFNRLQGALLREAYCLVRDGVVSVEEIDALVRDGLGLRWSIVGPFETVDLNTRGGIERHAKLLGPAYEAMGAERGQHDPWTDELVANVSEQRRAALPLDAWADRVRWRDRELMRALLTRRSGES